MIKTPKKKARPVSRPKFHDEQYLGSEPVHANNHVELARALNWYNYFYDADAAKGFVVEYMKSKNADKAVLRKVNQIKPADLRTIGWVLRMVTNDALLPDGTFEKTLTNLASLVKKVSEKKEEVEPEKTAVVISLQDRVQNRVSELIAEIDQEIDWFLATDAQKVGQFEPVQFFREEDVKPVIAQAVANHYKPLYNELFDAMSGKDKDLAQAYSCYKKPVLKKYTELVRNIIGAAEGRAEKLKVTRKPRAKKEKAPGLQVAKVLYQTEDTELGLKSIKPTEILGGQQLWVYSTKYKKLTVYNAMGPAGFSIKGTTLQGWDEKISVSKRLRKPADQLKTLMTSGKVGMRKFMDQIRTTAQAPNGRLNRETILLRVSK